MLPIRESVPSSYRVSGYRVSSYRVSGQRVSGYWGVAVATQLLQYYLTRRLRCFLLCLKNTDERLFNCHYLTDHVDVAEDLNRPFLVRGVESAINPYSVEVRSAFPKLDSTEPLGSARGFRRFRWQKSRGTPGFRVVCFSF